MSNYPAGVTDNDPYFTDESEQEDTQAEWECGACGVLLSGDMVDSLTGHRRVDDDGHGNPVEVHCGPCYPVTIEGH